MGLAVPAKAAPAAAAAPAAPAAPLIPFTRGSRKKTAFALAVGPQALTANIQPVNPIEIPAQGFLRFVDLEITITAAGNAAAVAFAADGPFNVLSSVTLTNSAGDPIVVPFTGYQLMLMRKYGAMSEDAPFGDARNDPQFTLVTGAAGTGGSAHFFLRVPGELDPRDAFGAIPNLASNKNYMLNISLAALGTIYTTQPTAAPTVTITGESHYWAQPKGTNVRGIAQQASPDGNGSVSMWRLQTPGPTPGDNLVKLTNVGNVLRVIIFILRTAAGARTTADWPATTQFILNDDPMFTLRQAAWESAMARAYGLVKPTTGGTAISSKDVAGGLDTGVYVLYQFMKQTGSIIADHPRDQYLPTLDASKAQLRGTSWGAAASTLEVISNEIKPISARALYGKGGTQ